MKNHSLGDWSIGLSKAIWQYSGTRWDQEKEQEEQKALQLLKAERAGKDITDNSDITDYQEDADIEARISSDVNNLNDLAEDDENGLNVGGATLRYGILDI